MGDTLRDEAFDNRDVAVDFFRDPEPVRFVSLSEEVDFDLDSKEDDDDDLRFFASGFDLDDDSFCFLFVGGLCALVANTLLVLRFLPVAVDPGRSPVTGCRFSFSMMVVARALIVVFEVDVDGDNGVSVILREDFDWVMLGWDVSKNTLKELRVDIIISIYLIKK